MTMTRKPVFDERGLPNYGYCPHGEANGFCDRGGCDEFFAYLDEEQETERRRYEVKFATDKQIAYLQNLVRTMEVKTITPADSETLRRYLGNRSNIDPTSEWVFIPTHSTTICFYDLASFVAKRDKVMDSIKIREQVLMADVSDLIKTYKTFTVKKSKATEPTATNQNLATAKQLGFIKSLLNKKVVSDEANALREANPELTSKIASQLIGLLLASPDKA